MSIDRWMAKKKKNVVYTYNVIVSQHKKEGNWHINFNINYSWRYYTNFHEPDTKGQILYNFTNNEVPRQNQSQNQRIRKWNGGCQQWVLGRRDQGGSGGTNKMVLWPPPQNFPTSSRPHKDTPSAGRQDLCRKPEPYLTQTPYKGISSNHPIVIPPVTCPNTYHPMQTHNHLPLPLNKNPLVLPWARLPWLETSLASLPCRALEPCPRVHPIKNLFQKQNKTKQKQKPPVLTNFPWPLYFIFTTDQIKPDSGEDICCITLCI